MNIVAHVEIPVTNLERAMTFYEALFGVEFGPVIELHGHRMVHFPFENGKEGASCALAQGDVYVPTVDGNIVYLSVGDIDHALSRAVDMGGAILFDKTEVDGGVKVAEIRDSEGNRIGLQTI